MILKTDTEIICLALPEFFLNCLIMCQNARKMHHFEAKKSKNFLTAPSPLGGGHTHPKPHPCVRILSMKKLLLK